jgi:O-antigen/teichoic acid export membrane protein
VFAFVFGEDWRIAGEYTRVLAPAMATRFVCSPLTSIFGASNRQEVAAAWQVTALIVTALGLAASLPFNDPMVTVYALSATTVVLYGFYLVLVFRVAGASFRRAINAKVL